jgi:hypothetical protein
MRCRCAALRLLVSPLALTGPSTHARACWPNSSTRNAATAPASAAATPHTLYFTPPGNPAGVPPGPAHRFPEWGLCVGIL